MENTEDIQQDLLADEANPYFQYDDASQGQRFLNYLIDNILMRFTITYITGYGIGFTLAYFFPQFIKTFLDNRNAMTTFVIAYMIVIFNYIIYYTILEKLLHGKTVGKFITGTHAIRMDGNELTFKDALLRSICRLIPFEMFSGFGIPWHDSLTDTKVVKTR